MAKYNVRIGEQIYIADSRQPLINALPNGKVIKGCLKGVCRVCRCKLVSGRVLEDGNEVAFKNEFLPCISNVNSDAEITPCIINVQSARIKRNPG